jgi:hypothetical protein
MLDQIKADHEVKGVVMLVQPVEDVGLLNAAQNVSGQRDLVRADVDTQQVVVAALLEELQQPAIAAGEISDGGILSIR